jgi:hypothetical protein
MSYLKSHWLELLAIFVAIGSALLSYHTWRQSFLLSNRPFLWVENFSYLDENNKLIPQVNTVAIKVINSPAEIIASKFHYYILEENGNIKTIYEQPGEKEIKYPDDKVQYTHSANFIEEDIDNILKPKDKFIRFIRIEYKWLSSNRSYYFEGKWEYNKNNRIWDTIYQKAN